MRVVVNLLRNDQRGQDKRSEDTSQNARRQNYHSIATPRANMDLDVKRHGNGDKEIRKQGTSPVAFVVLYIG